MVNAHLKIFSSISRERERGSKREGEGKSERVQAVIEKERER
jgi:hypothetical protein